ncbi:uncharacterized protein [Nicotiana sylvestris]|uniref:uncharacterized protein n=1 Tax=Nicotiana sylvestris TaxID=4096 RepID=UPI00388CAFCF
MEFEDIYCTYVLVNGNSVAKKVRGPTLLKDIWKLPPGKTINVPFNNRNQAIGKEGRKLASSLGIIVRTPELTPLHIDDWRNFHNEEKKKLVDFSRRRTQANRNNRSKQTMPHTGGSKSIATLMNEQAVNGIEPTRAEIFLLTHKKHKDGRPLDDDSVKTIVLVNEKSGYVRGLGLGPTPSVLWGSRSFLGNIAADDSSNEVIQRLQQQIIELKEKQNEEINIMKQNQENMQSELLQMRQLMRKYAPNASMPQSSNGTLGKQIPDANSGHERVPQTSRIYSAAENAQPSHGHSLFCTFRLTKHVGEEFTEKIYTWVKSLTI